jgi:hypothetical protein
MKKAILLPYHVDQNAPSRPLDRVVVLPDNVKERDKLLKKLFVEHVLGEDYVKEFGLKSSELKVTKGSSDDYGDLIVEFKDDQYLFVTYVKG